MAPKAADQAAKNGRGGNTTPKGQPLLQLPDFDLGGPSNGVGHDHDDGGFDQDAAPDPLQAALGFLSADVDGDADEQQDLDNLVSVLRHAIATKNEKQHKKQKALLQEAQEAAVREIEAFQAAVVKDHKQAATVLTQGLNQAKKQMAEKIKAIEEINAKYNQDITQAWNEYQAVYGKVQDTQKAAHKRLEKVNDNHKRKFAELQTSLKQRLVETEQKMAKLDSKAGKARKVEGLLKQFL